MNRRNFIRVSTLGAATGMMAPTVALASTVSMAGGVYYTKEAPGRWSKKIESHLPIIEVSGKKIQVTTPHGMTGYDHYIVKHMILNDKFEFIDEKMFDPTQDKAPISQFDLGNYSGRIHVLSACNKHDTWLNMADI